MFLLIIIVLESKYIDFMDNYMIVDGIYS